MGCICPLALAVRRCCLGGMFVGMVASALEEILEVAPVLMHRFRLGDMSLAFRWTLLLGKALGAVLASLLFTL